MAGDLKRKFSVILALNELDAPTIEDLHNHTSIPTPSLRRHLKALESELFMSIKKARKANVTHYILQGWGVLDRDMFLRKIRADE